MTILKLTISQNPRSHILDSTTEGISQIGNGIARKKDINKQWIKKRESIIIVIIDLEFNGTTSKILRPNQWKMQLQ